VATPLVLEVMGPPCAGKTTVAGRLEGEPRLVVLKDHERGDLPALLRGVLASLPELGTRPAGGVSRVRWAAWAGRVTAAPELVGRRADAGAQVVVLDQGPAYTLGRMAPARRSPAAAGWWERRLQACADLLDLVLLLDADPTALLARVRSRPKHHAARHLTAEAALRLLDDERERCRTVAGQLEQRGVIVIRLDTGRLGLDDQLHEVRAALFRRPAVES